RLAVTLGALALKHRALVPVELEPDERVEDLLHVLAGRPLAVGVLDAQQELALPVARQQPVEQRRARAPDVERPRWRWREANPHNRFLGYFLGSTEPICLIISEANACWHSWSLIGRSSSTPSGSPAASTRRRRMRRRSCASRRASGPRAAVAFAWLACRQNRVLKWLARSCTARRLSGRS